MLVVFMSISIALAICIGFYYFKIQENEKFQNQLHFRELKNITTSLDNGIASFKTFADQRSKAIASNSNKNNLTNESSLDPSASRWDRASVKAENDFNSLASQLVAQEDGVKQALIDYATKIKQIQQLETQLDRLINTNDGYRQYSNNKSALASSLKQNIKTNKELISLREEVVRLQKELYQTFVNIDVNTSSENCRMSGELCLWINSTLSVYRAQFSVPIASVIKPEAEGKAAGERIDELTVEQLLSMLNADVSELGVKVREQQQVSNSEIEKFNIQRNTVEKHQRQLREFINSSQFASNGLSYLMLEISAYTNIDIKRLEKLLSDYRANEKDKKNIPKQAFGFLKGNLEKEVYARQIQANLIFIDSQLSAEKSSLLSKQQLRNNNLIFLENVQRQVTVRVDEILRFFTDYKGKLNAYRAELKALRKLEAITRDISDNIRGKVSESEAKEGGKIQTEINILHEQVFALKSDITNTLSKAKKTAFAALIEQGTIAQWLALLQANIGIESSTIVKDFEREQNNVRACIELKLGRMENNLAQCFGGSYVFSLAEVYAAIEESQIETNADAPAFSESSPLHNLKLKSEIETGFAQLNIGSNGVNESWGIPIQDWLGGSNEVYPLVLLVDSQGKRITSRQNTQINSSLVGIEFDDVDAMLQERELDEKSAKSIKAAVLESSARGVSKFVDIRISGIEYRLFISPFSSAALSQMANIKAPQNAKDNFEAEQFYVIGLREKSRFDDTTLTISRSLVTVAILFTLSLIAFVPLLKIRLSSISQAFSAWDRHTLAVGCVLLTTVISVGIYDYVHYENVKAKQTKLSKSLFMQMRNAFDLELDTLVSLAYTNIQDKKDQVGIFRDYLLLNKTESPYFLENLFVLKGKSSLKESALLDGLVMWATTKRYRGLNKNISLESREYANRGLTGDLWPVDINVDNEYCQPGMFIERLFNLRDGAKSTQFAVSCNNEDTSSYANALSFGTQLQTFTNTVFPQNFGFVVFDNATGKALYHSEDNKRSLVENVFVETDDNELLQAYMNTPFFYNQPTSFDAIYSGKVHHFTLGALKEGVPWTLVIFYDKEETRALNLMSVLVTLTFCFIVFVLLYYFAIMIIPKSKRRGVFWPTPSTKDKRKNAAIIGISIGFVTIFGVLSLLISEYVFSHHELRYAQINNAKLGENIAQAKRNIQSYRENVLDKDSVITNEISEVPCFLGTEEPSFIYSKQIQTCQLSPKQNQLDNFVRGPVGYVSALIENLWKFSVLDGNIDETLVVTTQLNLTHEKMAVEAGFVDNNLNQYAFERKLNQNPLFEQEQAIGIQGIVYVILMLIAMAAFALVLFKLLKEWIFVRFFGFNIPPFFRLQEKTRYDVYKAMQEHFFEHNRLMMVIRPKLSTQLALRQNASGRHELNKENVFYDCLNQAPLACDGLIQVTHIIGKEKAPEDWIKEVLAEVKQQHPNKTQFTLALQGIENTAFNGAARLYALELMEKLLANAQLNLILLCEQAPLYRLTQAESYPSKKGENEKASASEMMRWSEVLMPFIKVYDWSPQCKARLTEEADAAKTLQHESMAWPELRSVLKQFLIFNESTSEMGNQAYAKLLNNVLSQESQPVVNLAFDEDLIAQTDIGQHWLPEQIIEFFAANASAIYRFKWEQCTKVERVILYQIASGLEPNPLNRGPLEHLVRRGYICRDRGWFIVNQSFSEFILSAEPAATFEAWLSQANESVWQYLRIPFFAIVIVMLAIMAYTATDAIETALGVLTAVFGLIPLALRNFSMIKSDGS